MAIPTYRECNIKIENKCCQYLLSNPCMHIASGTCETPLPPTVSPSGSGEAKFVKTPYSLKGCVGVFTYDLQNESSEACQHKIAVMFSVPFDYNIFKNTYAVGVFPREKKCDHELFKEMYEYTQSGFVRKKASGEGLIYKSESVTMRATMSDSYQPVIMVQVFNN